MTKRNLPPKGFLPEEFLAATEKQARSAEVEALLNFIARNRTNMEPSLKTQLSEASEFLIDNPPAAAELENWKRAAVLGGPNNRDDGIAQTMLTYARQAGYDDDATGYKEHAPFTPKK